MERGYMGDSGNSGGGTPDDADRYLDHEDDWVMCEKCGGDGVNGHDCGEDTCCCLHPEENMACDICGGEGGWTRPDPAVGDA